MLEGGNPRVGQARQFPKQQAYLPLLQGVEGIRRSLQAVGYVPPGCRINDRRAERIPGAAGCVGIKGGSAGLRTRNT